MAYLGKDWKQSVSRVNLLKFVGDLLIISGLLLLCAGISSALTINLFESIHFPIGEFYGKNIVGWLLAPIPLVGVYLLQTNTQNCYFKTIKKITFLRRSLKHFCKVLA